MWIDKHPYLSIYLLGCLSCLILVIFRIILIWMINWLTKTTIVNKNLKKLLPPDKRTFSKKAEDFLIALVGIAFDLVLSWIGAVLQLLLFVTSLLFIVRETFSSTPEAIKLLRFPLKNNPNMPRESVWAYFIALKIKVGENPPSVSDLLASLNELFALYPFFDRVVAIKQLETLNVVSPDLIKSVLIRLSPSEEKI